MHDRPFAGHDETPVTVGSVTEVDWDRKLACLDPGVTVRARHDRIAGLFSFDRDCDEVAFARGDHREPVRHAGVTVSLAAIHVSPSSLNTIGAGPSVLRPTATKRVPLDATPRRLSSGSVAVSLAAAQRSPSVL